MNVQKDAKPVKLRKAMEIAMRVVYSSEC